MDIGHADQAAEEPRYCDCRYCSPRADLHVTLMFTQHIGHIWAKRLSGLDSQRGISRKKPSEDSQLLGLLITDPFPLAIKY